MVSEKGKNLAIASLVLGIASIVCLFFGIGSLLSIAAGIVGIVMASKSKKEGFVGGIRTAGFVTSIIGLAGGGVMLMMIFALGGLVAAAGLFV